MGTQKNRLNEAVLLRTQNITAKTHELENIHNFTLKDFVYLDLWDWWYHLSNLITSDYIVALIRSQLKKLISTGHDQLLFPYRVHTGKYE